MSGPQWLLRLVANATPLRGASSRRACQEPGRGFAGLACYGAAAFSDCHVYRADTPLSIAFLVKNLRAVCPGPSVLRPLLAGSRISACHGFAGVVLFIVAVVSGCAGACLWG